MASQSKPGTVQFPEDWDDGDDCPSLVPSSNRRDSELPILESKNDDSVITVNGEGGDDAARTISNGKVQSPSSDCTSSSGDDDSESDEDKEDGGGHAEGHRSDSWKQEDGAAISCECLVCNHETTGYEAADLMKTHIESTHSLSFEKLKTVFNLTYQQFVQFVRWARDMKSQGVIEACLQNIWSIPPKEAPWLLDKYILPPESAKGIDYFLTLDHFAFDGIVEATDEPSSTLPPVNELINQIQRLQLDQQRMVSVFQRVVEGKDSNMGNSCAKVCEVGPDDPDQEEANPSATRLPTTRGRHNLVVTASPRRKSKYGVYKELRKVRLDALVSTPSLGKCSMLIGGDKDEAYFDSYNDVGIHEEMVFDVARTEAYKAAIAERRDFISSRLVLDLGCGSGILSMFCAEHNPKMVYAVDRSEIVYDAMSNCFENNLQSKIKFLRKDLDYADTIDDDVQGVDVIVSEFMGYFLFFEGMTETFIRARDKFLKPGGILLPDRCAVFLAPVGATGIYAKKVACWDNAYGYRMPAMQARVLMDTHIETIVPSEVIGGPVEVKNLDLMSCSVNDIFIEQDFEMKFDKDGELCAIAGYFSVSFGTGNNATILSTSPWDTPTHWKQAVFFLPKRFAVKKGETMAGHISSHPHPDNPRWLVVRISLGGLTQRYEFH